MYDYEMTLFDKYNHEELSDAEGGYVYTDSRCEDEDEVNNE